MPPYVSKYQGQQLTDNAGNYKGECLSLIKWVEQHDLGLDNADTILHAVNGAAKDLWLSPQPIQEQYFDKIPTSEPPQVNDIVVYTNGTYGDVAFYVGQGQVFGQLGTPVFKPAAVRGVGTPGGYLRRKGEDMQPANEGDLENIFEAVYALPVAQADKDFWLKQNLSFKDLFYAVKNSARYNTEHFINKGDVVNMKAIGIDLSKVQGKMWKDGMYHGASGMGTTGNFVPVTEQLYKKGS